jgi:hypothetical protein
MYFNFTVKDTYIFSDQHNMVLYQNPGWDPNGNNGKGDSIGRTVDAYIAYEDTKFISAVKECFIYKVDKRGHQYLQGYRHPDYMNDEYNDMSRDHIINTLILLKYINDEETLKTYSKKLRWKISDRFSFTIDSWLWMMGVAGSWVCLKLWYILTVLIMGFNAIWNKTIYKIAPFSEEIPQNQFEPYMPEQLTHQQLQLRKLLYPAYALNILSWQLYVLKDSWFKRLVQKLTLKITGKENFLMRLLLDDKNLPSFEDVYTYKMMTGGRWSAMLNETNDRDIRIITNLRLIRENRLEEDLLLRIYNKKYPVIS